KTLHPLDQAIFTDEDFILRIDGNGARKCKLTRIGTVFAPLGNEFTNLRKVVYPRIMRLVDNNAALSIDAHPFRSSLIPSRPFPSALIHLRHLPGKQKNAVR